MPLVKGVEQIRDAQSRCIGARVNWTDPTKGSQTFLVSQLPSNLTTAAAVEGFFNAIVGTLNGYDQTRVGAYFGCFAWTKVFAFQKGVFCEFDVVISDEPILSDPWA